MTNLERAAAVERAEMRACTALRNAGFDARDALERALGMGANDLDDECLSALDGVEEQYWVDFAAESKVAARKAKMHTKGKRKPRGATYTGYTVHVLSRSSVSAVTGKAEIVDEIKFDGLMGYEDAHAFIVQNGDEYAYALFSEGVAIEIDHYLLNKYNQPE